MQELKRTAGEELQQCEMELDGEAKEDTDLRWVTNELTNVFVMIMTWKPVVVILSCLLFWHAACVTF